MASKRVGGIIEVKADGVVLSAKGSFSWNLGRHKRESVMGHDGYHGYKELPQPGFIEGVITDSADVDIEAIVNMKNATVTLKLPSEKIIVVRDGVFTGEGTGTTEEGEFPVRWEGKADQVR